MIELVVAFRAAVGRVHDDIDADAPHAQIRERLTAARRILAGELDEVERQARATVSRCLPRSAPPGRPAPAAPLPFFAPPRAGSPPAAGAPWPRLLDLRAGPRGGAHATPPRLPAAATAGERPSPQAAARWWRRQICAQALTSFSTHRAVWAACCADLRRVESDPAAWDRRLVDVLSACFVVQREAEIWADTLDLASLEALAAAKKSGPLGRFLFEDLWLTSCAAMAGSPDSGLLDFDPRRHRLGLADASALVLARHLGNEADRADPAQQERLQAACFAVAARFPAALLAEAAHKVMHTPLGIDLQLAWERLGGLAPVEDMVGVRLMRGFLEHIGARPAAGTRAGQRR